MSYTSILRPKVEEGDNFYLVKNSSKVKSESHERKFRLHCYVCNNLWAEKSTPRLIEHWAGSFFV